MNRFQAVPYIRKRARHKNRHRIIEMRVAHGGDDIAWKHPRGSCGGQNSSASAITAFWPFRSFGFLRFLFWHVIIFVTPPNDRTLLDCPLRGNRLSGFRTTVNRFFDEDFVRVRGGGGLA